MRSKVGLVAVAVLAFAGALGGNAVANHVFPDVATNSPFHDEVTNIAGAGIATGFPDQTFRPRDPVTRQVFAAWTNRSGARVGQGTGSANQTVSGAESEVGTVQIAAGATGSGGGFVVAVGTVDFRSSDSTNGCPCTISAFLTDGTTDSDGAASVLDNEADEAFLRRDAITVTGVFPVAADDTVTIKLIGQYFDPSVGLVSMGGNLVAWYVPFGPDGGNDLIFTP